MSKDSKWEEGLGCAAIILAIGIATALILFAAGSFNAGRPIFMCPENTE